MNESSHQNGAHRRGITIGVITAVVIGIAVAVSLIGGKTSQPGGEYSGPPPATAAGGKDWEVVLHTSAGALELSLDGAAAPQAVANMLFLAEEGFFDGTQCHRLLPTALLQCGDPTASGTGGPGYSFGPIENAPADDIYEAGVVAMARVGGDGESMGSQFFLVFDNILLPSDQAGGYSIMGSITSGLELLQDIGNAGTVDGSTDGSPLTRVIIESVEVK